MPVPHLLPEEDEGPAAFGSYFVSTYPPFSAWDRARLPALEAVLDSESPGAASPFGLYVHIPFCEKRCRFCYYLSYEGRRHEADAYVGALIAELDLYRRRSAFQDREPLFVYFGGGTPSLLGAATLRSLFRGLKTSFPWRSAREVCFECAPQTVTAERLEIWRAAGMTRLSMGVQSFDDAVLKANGRIHLQSDIERAWEIIARFDFPVVNLDLMVGLVGETDESFDRTVERTLDMGPESVTIYQLEIPLNTPLYRDLDEGCSDPPPASWPVKRARLERGFSRLRDAGYLRSTAYAAVRDLRHDRFVYQDDQYRGCDLLGLGASSFSYLGGVHQQNRARLSSYLEVLGRGALPLGRAYSLDPEERMVREVVLHLKLGKLDLGYFERKFGVDLRVRFAATLGDLEQRGLVRAAAGCLELSDRGLSRVDELLPSFYLTRHCGLRYS